MPTLQTKPTAGKKLVTKKAEVEATPKAPIKPTTKKSAPVKAKAETKAPAKKSRREKPDLSHLHKIELDDIRKTISEAIEKKYNQTVYAFCRSGIPEKKLGVKGHALENYLAHGGSKSFEVFKNLYEHLGLGELARSIEKVTTVTYYTA